MTNQSFTNDQLHLEQLPQILPLEPIALEPVYCKANFFIRLAISLTLVSVALIVKFQTFSPLPTEAYQNFNWIIAGLSLLCLWWVIFGIFSDKARGYAVREQDISCYYGVIFKKIITQPLLRLQHIELKRGPVERKVGLATIQVFSAGGALHTFELPGLSLQHAEQLRQFMLDHKDVSVHE